MLQVPALQLPGEICWVAVRNLRENPDHAEGDGKLRPGILVGRRLDRWLVIGTTSVGTYLDGSPRVRIPDELWAGALPALYGGGYLWGSRVQHLPREDIGHHIGWAPPELRAFAVAPISNLSMTERNAFLRLRPDELAEG